MEKFCQWCGNQTKYDTASFCPNCGAYIGNANAGRLNRDVQPPTDRPNAAQQPVYSSYYPPSTTFTESKSTERSFYYSNIFYIVIILDLIITFICGTRSGFIFFDVSSSQYHVTFVAFMAIILLTNFVIDMFIFNKMRNSPHSIDSNSCWIKSIFGFFGIVTVISGIYFLIISIRLKRAYDATRRSKERN